MTFKAGLSATALLLVAIVFPGALQVGTPSKNVQRGAPHYPQSRHAWRTYPARFSREFLTNSRNVTLNSSLFAFKITRSDLSLAMPVTFVAYIDESGDTGLEQVKKPGDPRGATEWLVLSALVVKIEHDTKMVAWVQDVQSDFISKRTDLHFNKLLDFKKTLVCSSLAKKDCKGFVVMSNKKNIEKYQNPKLEGANKSWIYWFLARLILERVTAYCEDRIPHERREKDKLRIIFSRRGGLRYKDFNDYLWKLYWQTGTKNLILNYKTIKWSVIDFNEILVLDHVAKAGLQLSDVVAGAFYQAVEQNRGGGQINCDPSYAKLLKPIIASKNDWFLGIGIKPMPLLREMNLTLPQREVFEHYGFPPDEWEKKSG